jgi:polysaccharide export outer membrane protein
MRNDLKPISVLALSAGFALGAAVTPAFAQTPSKRSAAETSVAAVAVSPDYVIGPEDQLSIVFFQNHDMSADVVVRPDGKISLPLINEIKVSGLTPEQLREEVRIEAKRFVQEPNPTVVVKQINSRKVFITGAVEKPGTYSLNGPTTILQLIAAAGGLKEYADSKNIAIVRNDNGRSASLTFNYQEFLARKNFDQNVRLQPGDTVIVR